MKIEKLEAKRLEVEANVERQKQDKEKEEILLKEQPHMLSQVGLVRCPMLDLFHQRSLRHG